MLSRDIATLSLVLTPVPIIRSLSFLSAFTLSRVRGASLLFQGAQVAPAWIAQSCETAVQSAGIGKGARWEASGKADFLSRQVNPRSPWPPCITSRPRPAELTGRTNCPKRAQRNFSCLTLHSIRG